MFPPAVPPTQPANSCHAIFRHGAATVVQKQVCIRILARSLPYIHLAGDPPSGNTGFTAVAPKALTHPSTISLEGWSAIFTSVGTLAYHGKQPFWKSHVMHCKMIWSEDRTGE